MFSISKRMVRLLAVITALTFIQLAALPVEASENSNSGRESRQALMDSVEFFSGLGSRVPGYEGNRQAADYIYERFNRIGLGDVVRDAFSVTVPVDRGGFIETAGGSRYPVHAMWPNMVKTSTVPPEGLEGKFLYAGRGEYKDYAGHDLQENIVFLDFNSGNNWLKAAGLGAKAVVFIQPEDTGRKEAEAKFVEVPLDVPRFMIAAGDFDSLAASEEDRILLRGRMDWEEAETWNIFGYIEGSCEELADELVVLSAYYDSMSVAPAVAPGAGAAAGIAALLDISEYLSENPPARTVLILAASGHFTGLHGIDDFVQKRARNIRPFIEMMEDPLDIDLFIGLDLSTGNDEVGLFNQGNFFKLSAGDEFYYQRLFAPFGSKFEGYAEDAALELGLDAERYFINGITPRRGINWNSYLPDNLALDHEIVRTAGNPALSFVTANDFRNLVDTPSDTFEKVGFDNLARQVGFIKPLIETALNDPELLPEHRMDIDDELYTLLGRIVTFDPRKSFVPDEPVEGAVAFIRNLWHKTMSGVRTSFYGLTDDNGEFFYSRGRRRELQLEAYKADGETGRIVMAPDRGVNGDEAYPMEINHNYRYMRHMIVLFDCVATDVYDLVDPRFLTQLDKLHIFGEGDSEPYEYGYSVAKVNYEQHISDVEPYGVIFSRPGARFKVGLASDILGYRLLYLNSPGNRTEREAEGLGYDSADVRRLAYGAYLSASDMLNLNEYRIRELLERYGIRNERLQALHSRAGESLKLAGAARADKQWDDFMKHSLRASAIESRAYPDVRATTDDVIVGVIFYMFLLVPFAYFMERLIFTFADLRKQIVGAGAIFLVIYAIMRFVHPAFMIADAPEVILLGFVILTLSLIVLSLVNSKFQEQMQMMKQKQMKVYQADVGRLGASGTAFALGVSNMKKRKVRTTLTSITLILLTFTVLSFTSISTYMRFSRIPRPNEPSYQGALIRDRVWQPIEKPAFEQIYTEFSGSAVVSPRAWLISRERDKPYHMGIRTDDEAESHAYALGGLGLSHKEYEVSQPQQFLTSGSWFAEGERDVCILPDDLAGLLGITDADAGEKSVRIMGGSYTVKGIFDTGRIRDFVDLDNSSIAPADFTGLPAHLEQEISRAGTADPGRGRLETFTHLDMGNVVILPYETVRELGGNIQSVAVRFHEGEDVRESIEDFVSRLAVTLFAGIEDRVTVYSSMAMTSFAGMGNLFIPILIASFIVLNTMMGSVYERFKEIGIYSSVGLAPVHIGSLFIAESSVFAILGGIAGYLLGQVVVRVLTGFGVLAGLTLNYSSLAAVFSTMLVMVVVLLSTIYPAKKASQMAVPDVTRRWVLPEPKGDLWDFEFPFTISSKETLGLYLFLSEYFRSFEDESVGHFYTQETELSKHDDERGEGFCVFFKSWLAPFDLGVSQEVQMLAVPTEYEIFEIHVKIKRLSGDSNNWVRLNRRFLNLIRKQFLIWRTIDQSVKEEYEARGAKHFKS